MRKLTKSEKRLSVIFAMISFLFLNSFFFQWIGSQRKILTSKLASLKSEEKEAAFWLGEREQWEGRAKWLKEKQPAMKNPSEASAALLESVQAAAKKYNFSIVEQRPNNPTSKPPYYQEVSATIKLKGSLEALIKWLCEVQQPTQFHTIEKFNLKSDQEPPNVICDITLAKRYAPSP